MNPIMSAMNEYIAPHERFKPNESIDKFCHSASRGKGISISDSEFEKIIPFLINPGEVQKESLKVFEVDLANDAIDRDEERFSTPVLKSFAKTLPGKSFLIAHNWGPPGRGLFYSARVTEVEGVKWLRTRYYMLEEYNKEFIAHTNAGIYRWYSIGFMAPALQRVAADDENNDFGKTFYEYRNTKDKEAEALEGSLVWLGAQFDASVRKMFKALASKEFEDNDNQPPKEEKKIMKLQIKELNNLIIEITNDNDAIVAGSQIDQKIREIVGAKAMDESFKTGLKGIFGDDSDIDLATIKATKEDADAYKEFLVEEVVKYGSLLKLMPEDETELKNEKKELAELSVSRLKKQLKIYQDKYVAENPGKSDINGNDEDKDEDDFVTVETEEIL